MKEAREFEAANEAEAVRAAARELGVAEEALKYEVTDPGSRGILGMGGRPTKIVVTVAGFGDEGRAGGNGPIVDAVLEFQQAIIERMHLEMSVTVESAEEYVHVTMSGRDRDLLLQSRAELLEAFQYILNRVFSKKLKGTRILVDCDGFRRRKEEELHQIARRVSEKVRLTGQRQELGLMNPYERRIVHLAIAGEEGVTSESSGDGFMKRITVRPR